MRSSRGFTLIEALVALLMLSVGIVAVASSFSIASRAEARARRVAVACMLADQKMLELELVSAQQVGESEGNFGPTFPGYWWKARVTPAQTPDLYVAELGVYWGGVREGGQAPAQLVKVVTLLRI